MQVDPALVEDINFIRTHKRSHDGTSIIRDDTSCDIDAAATTENPTGRHHEATISLPSESELNNFYQCISEAKGKPVILKLVPSYSSEFVPKVTQFGSIFPKPVTELYDPETLELIYPDLLKKCKQVYSTIKV